MLCIVVYTMLCALQSIFAAYDFFFFSFCFSNGESCLETPSLGTCFLGLKKLNKWAYLFSNIVSFLFD